MGEPAELRASDADREQAVERLREAFADGRITIDELTGRLDRVYAATSRAQVGATVTDLPAAASPERFSRRRRPLLPGVSSFVERLDVPRAIDVVGEHVVTDIAPPLAKRGRSSSPSWCFRSGSSRCCTSNGTRSRSCSGRTTAARASSSPGLRRSQSGAHSRP